VLFNDQCDSEFLITLPGLKWLKIIGSIVFFEQFTLIFFKSYILIFRILA